MDEQELLSMLLSDISFSFTNTKFSTQILENLTNPLKNAKTVGQLRDQLISVFQKYEDLNIYKAVNAKVLPGDKPLTAHVQFNFKEVQPFSAQIGYTTSSEGGALQFKGTLKNVFDRCEYTQGQLEYRHATKNYLFSLIHKQLFLPFSTQRLNWSLGVSHGWEDLCAKVTEQKDSVWGQVDFDNHKISLMRSLYNNYITTSDASDILLKEAIPFCENYLVYEFQQNPFLNLKTKLSDHIFSLSTSFSFAKQLNEKLRWENNLTSQFLFGSPRSNHYIRARLVRGFDAIAENWKAGCFGHTSFASFESRVLIGEQQQTFRPFVYAGFHLPQIHQKFLQSEQANREVDTSFVRKCLGLGLRIQINYGYFELFYASKIWPGKGDQSREWGLYFSSNI